MTQKLTRRASRENAFKIIFASSFEAQEEGAEQLVATDIEDCELDEFGEALIAQYRLHKADVDRLISDHLQGWALQRLPRVSLTVLRLALCEMLYGSEKLADAENPTGVAINEAVEITKKYGAEGDYQFVNGILGVIARELDAQAAAPAEQE